MAGYVDGFVMPLPKSNLDRYREIAAGEIADYKRMIYGGSRSSSTFEAEVSNV